MANLFLFVLICGVAVLANVVAIPQLMASADFYQSTRTKKMSLIAALTKGVLLSVGACAIGWFAAPRVGLSAPFIESIVKFDRPHIVFWGQLRPAFISSLYVLLGLALLHLTLMRRFVKVSRYFSLPLSTKILLYGVVEESVFRWGLMSLVARILSIEFLTDTDTTMAIAIVLAAVGSSVSHISDLSRFNFEWARVALPTIILVNFWGAIFYGWLFWKYGLTAAILCHVFVVFTSDFFYKVGRFFSFDASDGWV